MKRASLLLPLALLTLIPTFAVRAENDDMSARFKRAEREFREVKKSALWEEIKKRRDLVEAFCEIDHPGVVKILYEVFMKDREQVCRIPAMIGLGRYGNTRVLKSMVTAAVRDRNNVYVMCLPLALRESDDPGIGPWLLKNLFKQRKREDLRAAVIQSLGYLGTSEAYEPLLELLRNEEHDSRVMYEALLALGRIGKAQAHDPIVPYLEHKDRVVRQAAVLALAETGHPKAVEDVLPLAEDIDPRVQEAVASVIGKAKAEEGIPALIKMLRGGRLRVMDTARRVLEDLTGESFGIDPDAWEHWYKQKMEGTLPEGGKPEPGQSVATYYGMNILSDRVLFIIDISGSMDAGKPPRIQTAREELKKTLDQLNEKTMFNVVGFGSGTTWWKDEEVEATEKNREDAKVFVDKLTVGGGTNVYDTFEEAFEKNRRVDTIYFLGDGSPSVGTHTEQEEILARVRWMNRFRRVRINTIALLRGKVGRFGGRQGPRMGRGFSLSDDRAYDEEEAARFLARLSAENDGVFVKIDK